jgi:hypothetical protein
MFFAGFLIARNYTQRPAMHMYFCSLTILA